MIKLLVLLIVLNLVSTLATSVRLSKTVIKPMESYNNNVFGDQLQVCGKKPMTGWKRNGKCETDDQDNGTHTICAKLTDQWLTSQKKLGNDLITPKPAWDFPGLKAGDHWCVCRVRWLQGVNMGEKLPVVLDATAYGTLSKSGEGNVSLKLLKEYDSKFFSG